MKKLVIGILIAMMTVSISACGTKKEESSKNTKNQTSITENSENKEETSESDKEDVKDKDSQKDESKDSEDKKENDSSEEKEKDSTKEEKKDNSKSVQDELVSYVINNVPEIKKLKASLESNKSKMSIYVERNPDGKSDNKYYKDYYGIYVGQASSDHNTNIYRFAINKDTKDIVFYDVIADEFMSLDEWRNSPNYKR